MRQERKLFLQLLEEVRRLVQGPFANDPFMKDVAAFLERVHSCQEHLSNTDNEKLQLLGRAAVLAYQTFDEIEEVDHFVALACQVSREVAAVDKGT